MPKAHRDHATWSPSRIIHWAGTVGPKTEALVTQILATRRHPEQSYRSCLGIIRLGGRYGQERLEAACARAFTLGAYSYRHVESILKHGLDKTPLPQTPETKQRVLLLHENLRGPHYFN
jgi:transposase